MSRTKTELRTNIVRGGDLWPEANTLYNLR